MVEREKPTRVAVVVTSDRGFFGGYNASLIRGAEELHAAAGRARRQSRASTPRHLVVDLAGLTFCSAGGHTLLVGAGRTAGGQGTGYAVTGVSGLVIRLWMLVWPAGDLPIRYPTARQG